MGIIEAKDLVHEYIIRDEEGNVESIRTALDHMDLSVEAGQFIAVLGHNGSASLPLPSSECSFDTERGNSDRRRHGCIGREPDL